MKAGKGKMPKLKDRVKVRFEVRLVDGMVFDSGTAEWVTSSVVRGLREGLGRACTGVGVERY